MAHEADTETSPAQVQPEDDSENLVGDTKAPRLNRPSSVGPGGLVDRVTKTIKRLREHHHEPHRRRWAEARSGRGAVRRQRRGVYRQGWVVCRRHRVVSGQPRRRPTREREAGKLGLQLIPGTGVTQNRPGVGGSRPHRQDCRRVSGSSQCSTGEAADQESAARASSDRAGRHELHHHLAYGGTQ